MTLNPQRIKDIKQHGSYFDDGQVRALSELGAYLEKHGAIPNVEQLAGFTGRGHLELRRDLNSVTLEGFLWVFGVES